MASKYASLKGKIPSEQTQRDVALLAELERIDRQSVAELTQGYNDAAAEAAALAEQAARIKIRLDARKILILDRITESGGDGYKGLNGFTWTETFEPYPVCKDPAAVMQYFREHGMEDLLVLKASEINNRLENYVKEEALRGELQVETVQVVDPATGEEREEQVVRSQIPGVQVYLDTKLSRVRSGAKKSATVSKKE